MTDSMIDDSYREAFCAASKLREFGYVVQYWNETWTAIDYSQRFKSHFVDAELVAFAKSKAREHSSQN